MSTGALSAILPAWSAMRAQAAKFPRSEASPVPARTGWCSGSDWMMLRPDRIENMDLTNGSARILDASRHHSSTIGVVAANWQP